MDMYMTYDELSTFGTCPKVLKLGPYGMFQRLVHARRGKLRSSEVTTQANLSVTANINVVQETYWKEEADSNDKSSDFSTFTQ